MTLYSCILSTTIFRFLKPETIRRKTHLGESPEKKVLILLNLGLDIMGRNNYMERVIGYTTGVYDMFHIGHLNVIRHAKEQCDYLIVGVSTDELVQKDKGKTPVIPYEERAAIIAALKYVDEVVPQTDKNKVGAWEKYHFNKMFVGSDWQGTPQWKSLKNSLHL